MNFFCPDRTGRRSRDPPPPFPNWIQCIRFGKGPMGNKGIKYGSAATTALFYKTTYYAWKCQQMLQTISRYTT